MSVDLKELGRRVDEALSKETKESLTKWIKERRSNALLMDSDEIISTPPLGKTIKVKAKIRSVGKYSPSIIMPSKECTSDLDTYNCVGIACDECKEYKEIKEMLK